MSAASWRHRSDCSPENEPGPWPADTDIPESDFLYMRVLASEVDEDNLPKPHVFRNHGDAASGNFAMSTDWNRYCSPQATRMRSRRHLPESFGVIRMKVSEVRGIPGQTPTHAPVFNNPEDEQDPNNRGHTNVFGPKRPKDPGGSNQIRARYIALLQADEIGNGWVILPPKRRDQ